MIFLGTVVLSRSYVQVQVAESSCESEYHVYSKGDQAMAYFRLLVRDLAVFGSQFPTIPPVCANYEAPMSVAQGFSTRSYSKHIIFKIWLCWDYVHRGLVQFVRLPTDLQIVDFSTGHYPYIIYRGLLMSLCPRLLI